MQAFVLFFHFLKTAQILFKNFIIICHFVDSFTLYGRSQKVSTPCRTHTYIHICLIYFFVFVDKFHQFHLEEKSRKMIKQLI